MSVPVELPTENAYGADAHIADPHKRLMAAVLRTVVDDCQGGTIYQRTLGIRRTVHPKGVRQAFAYVASTDREWPFSFENLCEALGIDAGCARQELRRERVI